MCWRSKDLGELKRLSDETGLFESISDEEIDQSRGVTYQDVTALKDPLAGMVDTGPFDEALVTIDYDPNEPRDDRGRWTKGGTSGTMKKTKYAPSPQRNQSKIQVSPKKYGILCGKLKSRFPNLAEGDIRTISDGTWLYMVSADGYGGMSILRKKKLK